MKRITALIAFSSAMALATAASAQLGGGLVGGATGQVGGTLGGATGGLTGQAAGSAGAGAQGGLTTPSRLTRPAASATPSVTTGASTDAAAKAGDRQVSAGAGGSTTVQPSASTSVNPPVAGANSQGAANASATGVANANANAAIASTTAPDLTSLRVGQTVRDAAGMTLGSVSKVERAADGTVKNVLVAGADGQKKVMRLAPNSLSLSGDVVTTTSTKADAKSGTTEER